MLSCLYVYMSILFLAFVITLFIFAVGFVFLNILSCGCPRLRDIKGCLILILIFLQYLLMAAKVRGTSWNNHFRFVTKGELHLFIHHSGLYTHTLSCYVNTFLTTLKTQCWHWESTVRYIICLLWVL